LSKADINAKTAGTLALKRWSRFDDQTSEHVTLLEYHIKVEDPPLPPLGPEVLKAGKRKKDGVFA
jgi:hypothetical protein